MGDNGKENGNCYNGLYREYGVYGMGVLLPKPYSIYLRGTMKGLASGQQTIQAFKTELPEP